MIYGRRIKSGVFDFGLATMCTGNLGNDLLQAFLCMIADRLVQRTDRPGKMRFLRNNVVGRSCIELGYRYDDGMKRIYIARRKGLDRLHHRRTRNNGINAQMRSGRMPALAGDCHIDEIRRRQQTKHLLNQDCKACLNENILYILLPNH